MNKWATWQRIDKKLHMAWEKDEPGYKAGIGHLIFRLYNHGNEWIWEISDLDTGRYHSGTTSTKQTALEDINFQLTFLGW